MMFDKYHYEWIDKDFHTQLKIFNAQKRAFDFMKQLGDDAYSVAMDIKGGTLQGNSVRLELLDLALYYYKIDNGIGEHWVEVC